MRFPEVLVLGFGCGAVWGAGTYDVRDYGAKGDGVTLNTEFIQRAIDDAEAAGGGRVVVAAKSGNYLTGSLWLASNIILDIGRGSTLLGSPNKTDYPDTYTRSEGTMLTKHASLINAGRCLRLDESRAGVGDWCAEWRKLSNVTITGEGTIDGQGSYWWPIYRTKEGPLRPTLLGLAWVDGLTLSGLHVKNSPFWTVHLLFSRNIDVGHLTVSAPARDGHNTDGIDPDSCQRDIRNVLARDCTSYQTDRVARLKTAMGRGGTVENITWEGIVAHYPGTVIDIDMIYPFGVSKRKDDLGQTPVFRNLTFRNITATGALNKAGSLACLQQSPCENMRLEAVHVTLNGGAQGWTVSDIYGSAAEVLPSLKLPANPPVTHTSQSKAFVTTKCPESNPDAISTSSQSSSASPNIQSETPSASAPPTATQTTTSLILPTPTTTGGLNTTAKENCNSKVVYIVVPIVSVLLTAVACLGSRYFYYWRSQRGLKYRPVSGVDNDDSWSLPTDDHEFTTLSKTVSPSGHR